MRAEGGAVSRPAGRALAGDVDIPGDKSISHRALMLAGVAVGRTDIRGLLEGEDVLATAAAMRALGVGIVREAPGVWHVQGVGIGGLAEPDGVLDLGNSGTSARLLFGLLATHPLTAIVTGDASLRRRPMRRVSGPLSMFGAEFRGRAGGLLPMAVIGARDPLPIRHASPVASAQVKSAVLLAGLNAPGETAVIEPRPSRDHTERMLRHFGAEVRMGDGGEVAVAGHPELQAAPVSVPGDISSAAFPLVAAAILPGSEVRVRAVGLNPGRSGLIECLREMGANIELSGIRVEGGEPVGDITLRHRPLKAIEVPEARVPSMIDEFPVLAVAAAFAEGTTRMTGLTELRVKESDRLAAIADGLAACGVGVRADGDDLWIEGTEAPKGGGEVASRLDHRMAMAFLVLGAGARAPVRVDDLRPVATSFPGFVELMNGLGTDIRT